MFGVKEPHHIAGWRKVLSSRFLELIIASTVWCVLPGCGAHWVSFDNTSSQVKSIRGLLGKPDGDGPFPAVVLLHASGGLDNNVWGWANYLNKLGYVTLAVDTFGSRGLSSCGLSRHLLCGGIGADVMISDAYGAIAYLGGLPFVEGEKISIMGLSMGGSAVNRLASRARAHGRNFKSAIALYGRCDFSEYDSIPLLEIFGEHDPPQVVVSL
jgi:dienelactone hydrolase